MSMYFIIRWWFVTCRGHVQRQQSAQIIGLPLSSRIAQLFTKWNGNLHRRIYAALQSLTPVAAYFSSKQILPFDFAREYTHPHALSGSNKPQPESQTTNPVQINPCAARTVYIRFQANFRSLDRNIVKFDKNSFGKCLVNPTIQYWRCLCFINNTIFHSFEAGNCVSNSSFKWLKKYSQTIQRYRGQLISCVFAFPDQFLELFPSGYVWYNNSITCWRLTRKIETGDCHYNPAVRIATPQK